MVQDGNGLQVNIGGLRLPWTCLSLSPEPELLTGPVDDMVNGPEDERIMSQGWPRMMGGEMTLVTKKVISSMWSPIVRADGLVVIGGSTIGTEALTCLICCWQEGASYGFPSSWRVGFWGRWRWDAVEEAASGLSDVYVREVDTNGGAC